jgi:hypothetical protein
MMRGTRSNFDPRTGRRLPVAMQRCYQFRTPADRANSTRVPDASLSGHSHRAGAALTVTRWRQGTSESGDKAQGSLAYAFAVSPILGSSGPDTLLCSCED